MRIIDYEIKCASRSDRIEIFPFFDLHIGKRNCAEHAIRRQVDEILRREKMEHRYVRVIFGGDQLNSINPADLRRFDFDELADWFVEDNAMNTRERLNDICTQEVKRFCEIFEPVKHLIIGAIYGNHEKSMRTRQNVNVHAALCTRMEMADLTDEAFIRIRMKRGKSAVRTMNLYLRHGYGGGRTAGAEPNKLYRMLSEWEDADVCLSGHSHSFEILPPKPVLYVPRRGKHIPERFHYRYRFAANPGCWLYSHLPGPGSYESMAAYPARPMTTLKIVMWPFWSQYDGGGKKKNRNQELCKIELRDYPIL